MRSIFQNKALVTLGIAEVISNLGNWITMLALWGILIFRGEGTVLQSSAIMLAGLGPLLLFSPIAGWLSDRFDRKWLMVTSQLLGALPVIGLFFAREEWMIYTLLVFQSGVLSIGYPARNASIPTLVAEEDLTRANAFLQQLNSILKVAAPAFAGALVGFLGPHNAMVVDIVSFCVAAAVLLTLPSLPPLALQRSENEPTPPAQGNPLTVLRNSFPLQLLFFTMFFGLIIIMGFDVLSSVFVRDVLAGDETFFGFMIGAVGLGQVLAVLWLMARKAESANPWRELTVGIYLLTGLCIGCALAFYSASTEMARIFVTVGAFVGGMGNGFTSVQVPTLLQRLAPRELLGRMGGALQSVLTAAQLIAMLGMPLIIPAVFSMGQYFVAASVGILILASVVFLATRKQQKQSASGNIEQPLAEQPV